jgi:hypothetical protein
MFLKHKTTPDGAYDKTKARLVGNGATQKEHMYDFISSSTVALSSVFLLFNIASKYKSLLATFDIKGAFLNAKFGEQDEVTYIRINKELTPLWLEQDPTAANYVDDTGCLTLQLDRFIYGLKQSPLKFQQHLREVLLGLGYKQLINDDCIYVKHDGADFSILSTHVDDILQTATDRRFYTELSEGLTKTYGDITATEEAVAYLGMSIDRSPCKSFIKLTQRGLTDTVLEKHHDSSRTTSKTPAADNLFDKDKNLAYQSYLKSRLNRITSNDHATDDEDTDNETLNSTQDETTTHSGRKPSDQNQSDASGHDQSNASGHGQGSKSEIDDEPSHPDDYELTNKTTFLSLIMTLMYLARLTRPDILMPVTYLASKSHIATKRDNKHLTRILKYLEYTKDNGVTIHCNDLSVHTSCDASHITHTDGRGHTGFFVGLGEEMSFLHCRSNKQKTAAQSSTEAEILAATDSLKFSLWVRNLISELQVVPLQTITLSTDNMSSKKMYTERTTRKRSKHLLSKICFIADLVRDKVVTVIWTATNDMIADLLTKPLQGAKFQQFVAKITGSNYYSGRNH